MIVLVRTRPRVPFLIGFSQFSLLEARRRRGDRAVGPYHCPPLNVPVSYTLGRGTHGVILTAKTLIDKDRDVTVALLPAPGVRTRIPLPAAPPPPELLANLADLFASLPWTYARTYHDTAPHYWCKRSQFPDEATFRAVCEMIPRFGYRHRFPDGPGGSWWQALDIPPRTVWTGWTLPQHHILVNSRPLVWAGRPPMPLHAHQEVVVEGAVQVPLAELLALLPEVP